MKLAVVHNLPPGGARRRLACQLEHLSGDHTEICLATATPITGDAWVIPCRAFAPALPRQLRPPLRYLDLEALVRAWRRAAVAVREARADAVYVNPCRFLQAPPLLLSDLPPTLYFCDEPRRVDSETDAASTRNPVTRPLYGPLYARERTLDHAAVARAGMIATNSRYTAGELRRVYGREATVVAMGVADALLAQATPATPGHLLSVGALLPSKGHDLVVRAAALTARRWPVVIVAPRPAPEEEGRLRSLAGELGVHLDVRVAISDEALRDAYGAAQATCYMSRKEPFGLVSLEAQAAGCPVIVADEGGLPETVEHGRSGWCAPRDPEAVAAFVDRLDDPAVRGSMAQAAAERGQRATWRVSAAQIERLLEQVHAAARRSA